VTNVSTELDGLCYQYKYDARNRLVEKKLPGKQWEYIVYDKLDRVVATGPAYNPWGGSDTNKGWLITKYDVFNRPVYIAWYTSTPVNSSTDRKKMQTGVDSSNILSESKSTATTTIDAVTTKYTNTVFPTSFKLLTVNYYDSYDFPNAPTIPSQIEGQNTQSTNLKGMPTGSWVRVLDNASSTTNETSYTVYDTRYRPIRSYTKNYLGGYTQVDTKLDWAGKTLYTITSQRRTNASELFTVKDRFEYSPQDRLTKHVQQLTSPTLLPEQLLTLNTYDELGQLTSKKVGGTDVTGAQALQSVDYSYNIRGWLKAINDVNNLGTDLFAFKINYNNPETATPLFNGNISETFWRTNSDNIKRKYNYSYDGLNRLLQANYSKPDAGTNLNNYKEWLNYDANGNITDIVRTGFIDPVAGTVENVIDNLKFVYDTASQNRLLKVNDLSNSPQGFKDNYTSTANDFTYDNNGNMTADNNKGIVSITYNHLNLPIKLNFGAKGEITYLYNAAGQKLQKFVKDIVSNTNTTTDYLSGFQYLNTTLQFFPHAEGYVHYTRPLSNSQLGSFNYVFNYTDHLGNVRVSFANDPLQGNVLKILEENHYYAFGMKHENYNVTRLNFKYYPETGVELVPLPAVANASYNVKFNGKELQEELGLNFYDYGARNYDPALGRWMNIDPLAEKYPNISPYVYAFNNPINFIDPDGRDGIRVIDKENKTITIKAVYYVQTEKSTYYTTGGKMKTLDGYSSNDISKMQSSINTYLNESKNNVVSDGEYKDYKVVYDLQFKEGGTGEQAKEKANNEKFEGVSIGNSIELSNSSAIGYFKSKEKTDDEGNITTSTVGGVTSGNKNIIMNDPLDTFMNRTHEIFHTLGFGHPKGFGGAQGIMKYPPENVSQKDTNQISKDEFLPKIEKQ
jgi:RHS repeat-associated protein